MRVVHVRLMIKTHPIVPNDEVINWRVVLDWGWPKAEHPDKPVSVEHRLNAWHIDNNPFSRTESHTGAYLAEKTLESLDQFGLQHHIVSVCLDNASNNDVLVWHLALSLPNFPGAQFRGRCMAHMINLIAKAFMLVFSRPSPKKRKIATNARVLAKRSAPNNSTTQPSTANGSSTSEPTELDDPELPSLDELDTALNVTGELPDEGMEQHDTIEVQKAVGAAIEGMVDLFGVRLSDDELKEAREIFPKATGLRVRFMA
ncbi:hypothetical protein RSOL_170680, partial [Rhizoctonia solani AG-3 Rhs1AP]